MLGAPEALEVLPGLGLISYYGESKALQRTKQNAVVVTGRRGEPDYQACLDGSE